jgi:hypothetical protein
MSFDATKWIRAQEFTESSHRYLALEIANYADNDGVAWPSVETLAKVTQRWSRFFEQNFRVDEWSLCRG